MASDSGAGQGGEHATALRALHTALYDLWQFGGNALVGWMPTRLGIEVLTVPKMRLFNSRSLPPRVFGGGRLMDRHTFNELCTALGVQSVELRLPVPLGDQPGALPVAAIDPIFSRFAVTRTDHRAVILFDIVGFSRFSPEEQACQLATLEFGINIAVEATREQGIPIDADRSTTGDGFYVWNRDEGLDADVNLCAGLVMFLTYHSLLRRRVKMASAVPTIRTAISIGSHYGYRSPNREGTRESEYIVGDVTISLARLMGKTQAEQVMIGDFQRPDDASGHILTADSFVQLVASRLAQVKDLSVLGNRLQRISLYLTGPRHADGTFGLDRLKIVDKHGFEHFGYNGKVNVFLESGETFYCGLQHVERPAEKAPA